METITKKSIVTNLIWRFFERAGSQGLMAVVTIILARLLTPSVFGIVALVMIFTTILQVFIDSGMGSALIQKKDADDLDFSSVFFFNIIVCLVLYLCMFFAAPLIALFYKMPELVSIIRILSITLIISGVRNIQQAYVSRYLLFKKFFYATVGGTICGAILGIWMAYEGCGVWALVVQHLCTSVIGTVILWYTVSWRPKKIFSFHRLKNLFSYGWKLLVSALLDTGYNNLTFLMIGNLYTPVELAFYERGSNFPHFIVSNINTAIDSVLFPTMSARQKNREQVRSMTRYAIKTSTYLMMPIMMFLAVCAESIVRLILTEKWLPCVFFLRIFCFTYAFWPVHTANLNAIKALGRSDLFLKLEVIKKAVGFLVLFATIFISIEAMALSLLFTSVLSQIINAWPNRRLLGYHYVDQLKDMLPQIGLSVVMGVVLFIVQLLNLSDCLTLLIQIPLGAVFYLFSSWLLHIDCFDYILSIVKGFYHN